MMKRLITLASLTLFTIAPAMAADPPEDESTYLIYYCWGVTEVESFEMCSGILATFYDDGVVEVDGVEGEWVFRKKKDKLVLTFLDDYPDLKYKGFADGDDCFVGTMRNGNYRGIWEGCPYVD